MKYALRITKKKFLTSALSDKRPKSIWRFIQRILKPENQTITIDVDDLNNHFITTANRVLKSKYLEPQDIKNNRVFTKSNFKIQLQFTIRHI